jgi:hypothetical protein
MQDSHLIAASTEMLAALRGVIWAHKHISDDDMPRWLNNAIEAVAKAEGKLKVSDPPYNERK